MKDIINRNKRGQLHGYQKIYYLGEAWFRSNYNRGDVYGYREIFGSSNNIIITLQFVIV